MGKKDQRVDVYISKSKDFAKPVLEHFRALVHKACPGIEETIKWGVPAFDFKGPICMSAAFKQHCAIVFWKASLMKDPALMENARSEAAMGHLRKITTLKDLPKDRVLSAYIKEAAKLNEAGIKLPAKSRAAEKKEIDVPGYFKKLLVRNKKASETFRNFSPAKKNEYIEWITEAKTDETRNKRIAAALEWMAEGKSRNWKYMRK